MIQKLLYALKVVRQRGLGFFCIYFRESILFDLLNGTSTSSRVPKSEQRISSTMTEKDNGLLYVASFTSVTRDTVAIAKDILGAETFSGAQFFDLGCGKGKALLVYAQEQAGAYTHPAVGIEYDPGLTEVARANAARCKLSPEAVEIFADSATNLMSYARSDILVIYLYNSFQGETLITVFRLLQKIPHVLIYVDPAERFRLDDYSYEIVAENQGRFNADTWLVAKSGLN